MALVERHDAALGSLDSPVLVCSLDGWIDAGFGAAGAMAALTTQVPTQAVATFDADALIDYRARRPIVRIVDGVHEGVTWQEIQLRAGHDPGGSGVLLLVGPEPDLQWRAFVDATVGLTREAGVRLAVCLGAFPAAVPHTRPVRLAGVSSSEELAATIGYVGGTVDVPAGAQAVLEAGWAEAGVPSLGLWARVPHYVATMPFPAAGAALIDGLNAVAGLNLLSGDLHAAAALANQRIDGLIANSDEHIRMVRELERQVDEAEPPRLGTDLPSGDELASELERFLREQG